MSTYDPLFDPVTDVGVGCGRDHAPTYWMATAGPLPATDGPVSADMDVDVAVIGSGFTGLSCALHLAKDHGIKATVLEANGVAFGCSTRNGGQAQISAGRLKRSQWIARYGLDVAKKLHAEMGEAFDLFRDLIRDIDCEPQDGGHLYIAHKPDRMAALETESRLLNETFGYGTRIVSRDEIVRDFLGDKEAAGAMLEPDGIGVHPARLAFGYARKARAFGARIHTSSEVIDWTTRGGAHYLRTPGGTVKARAVAMATAAYTPNGLHPLIRHRLMPILSNSVVTRPLTPEEIAACNFRTRLVITDTRTLRFYYRLLPDNRLQIGSRSAITGADAANDRHLDVLRQGIAAKFPALAGIKLDYSWWGWVDVSHDMMPRIVQPDPAQQIFYAMGYGGNGVMYSAQAGRRMAQLVAGKGQGLDLPIFQGALPGRGPLTPFRRIGQRAMYAWYHWRDER
jgi:glycine/D-amino acid oxidase-like deaminating enzyme